MFLEKADMPQTAETHNDLGIAQQQRGDWQGALRSFNQAVLINPSFAPAFNILCNAFRRLGNLTEATQAFEQALRLQPENPDIAYNLGIVYHDQGELDKAVHAYRQALLGKPVYAAEVSNNLGTALKEQGLLEEALAQYQETLTLQPDHALACHNLSSFASEGRYRFPTEQIVRFKDYMASQRGSPSERALYGFTLGTLLNKQGSYDEAFAFYQQANDLRKRFFLERNVRFDAKAHEALCERIMEHFGKSYFGLVKKWGHNTELPVFIIGMPRSGSTLVEQILASHPQVFGAGEIGEILSFFKRFTSLELLYTTPFPPNIRSARQWGADYLCHLTRLGHGAARVTVKTLENFLHLGLIATLFPRARIIHCRRDPLDVCLSCYFTNFQKSDFAWSLEDIGIYYRTYEKLMSHWSRVLPVPIHEVRYEDLIQNQETVTRNLISLCGLDWDQSCLSFFNTRRPVTTASTVQVRKPISSQALGRWKHYRAHLGPLFKALGLDPSKV